MNVMIANVQGTRDEIPSPSDAGNDQDKEVA